MDQLRAKGKIVGPDGEDADGTATQPIGCLALKAYLDTESLTPQQVQVGNVGHSWVAFQAYEDPSDKASWGFWPAEFFSTDIREDTPGEVRSPDSHSEDPPATVRRYPVTIDQLNDAYRYIASHWKAAYNLYTFNCTDFAVGVVEAAGHSAPDSGSLGVDYPNALAEGIREANAAEGRDEKGLRR